MAAFFARQSTWYSLLFKVIVDFFCCQEREKRSRSKDEPWRKGNNRAILHFFVEFMICVRSLCQTLLFSEVWHSLLVAKGPTKFGTVRQTAKGYRSTKSNTSFEISMAMISSRIALFCIQSNGNLDCHVTDRGCSERSCQISRYVMERAFFWYLNPISFTHRCGVARKRRHCIFLSFALPAPSRITSTSSTNPMFSITPALSRTMTFHSCRSRLPQARC